MRVYEEIARTVDAYHRCVELKNDEWKDKHKVNLAAIEDQYLPSGSGFDSGTFVNLDKSSGDKIVLETSYHHMGEGGFYEGWTFHTVTITPSLLFRFHMKVNGVNKNGIKDYIVDVFHGALVEKIDESTIRF